MKTSTGETIRYFGKLGWIMCLDCLRWHPYIFPCLTKEEKLEASSFPCYWRDTVLRQPFITLEEQRPELACVEAERYMKRQDKHYDYYEED